MKDQSKCKPKGYAPQTGRKHPLKLDSPTESENIKFRSGEIAATGRSAASCLNNLFL